MAVCQNLVPLVNIKIAGKWMFIPLKMVLIGIDPYPNDPKRTDVTRKLLLGNNLEQHPQKKKQGIGSKDVQVQLFLATFCTG